jgi:hypothetical protein
MPDRQSRLTEPESLGFELIRDCDECDGNDCRIAG